MSDVYETAAQALFTFLQASCAGTFPTIQRRFLTWESLVQDVNQGIAPLVQPALLVYGGPGFGGGKIKYDQRGRGRPPVRTLSKSLVIYQRLPGGTTPAGIDATTAADSVLTPLLAAVEAAFTGAIDSEGAVTLGRTVSHCWIEGDIMMVTGDIDPSGQGMVVIPVSILLP